MSHLDACEVRHVKSRVSHLDALALRSTHSGDAVRSTEIMERSWEIRRDPGRGGEERCAINEPCGDEAGGGCGDVGRSEEMWGDVRRCGGICGGGAHLLLAEEDIARAGLLGQLGLLGLDGFLGGLGLGLLGALSILLLLDANTVGDLL